MKILLDECLDVRLRHPIPNHDVFTTEYMGWKGVSNGDLLKRAAAEGFDLMLTVDKGTLHQLPQPLPISLMVLRVKRNSLKGCPGAAPEAAQ